MGMGGIPPRVSFFRLRLAPWRFPGVRLRVYAILIARAHSAHSSGTTPMTTTTAEPSACAEFADRPD